MDGLPRLRLARRRSLYGQDRRGASPSGGANADVTDARGAVLYSLAESHLTLGRGIAGSDRQRGLRLLVKRGWGGESSPSP
jgi:hypothetical protein